MRSRDPQMASLGNFLRVAAELWSRWVDGIASNVEESCMKYHRSNITCSARLRQKLCDSDDIQFFRFNYDICEWSLQFSQVQVWGRRKKALRNLHKRKYVIKSCTTEWSGSCLSTICHCKAAKNRIQKNSTNFKDFQEANFHNTFQDTGKQIFGYSDLHVPPQTVMISN